jgi:hypothetical protein
MIKIQNNKYLKINEYIQLFYIFMRNWKLSFTRKLDFIRYLIIRILVRIQLDED